jgi:hypothetical protein
MGGACSTHGRDEMHIKFQSENLKGRDHSEDLGVDGKILELILRKQSGKVKVKLSLCLTKHHAMKTYWGSGGIDPRILDLGTRWR